MQKIVQSSMARWKNRQECSLFGEVVRDSLVVAGCGRAETAPKTKERRGREVESFILMI
jgi:hypothetical protein